MARITALIICTLGSLLLSFSALAQGSQQPFQAFGDYKVYFSVFNSSFIQPDVASAYNLTRGKGRALVNIALVKTGDEGDSNGLPAKISGSQSNLMQQTRALKFKEITEPGATYYLAPVRFLNEEILHFTISVANPSGGSPFEVKFSKKLYHE